MHRALSTLALLTILSPLTASAQRPMNDETLLPLLESAESAALDEPALARAQAIIVRAHLTPGSALETRTRGVILVAEARLGSSEPTAPALEDVLQPIVSSAQRDVGEGRGALGVRRLSLAIFQLPPESPMAVGCRALIDSAVARAERVVATVGRSVEDCGSSRAARLGCRERRLEAELDLLDTRLAATQRADDTVPALMFGLGFGGIAVGVAGALVAGVGIGCLNGAYCDEAQHVVSTTLFVLSVATAGLGLISVIIGGAWLTSNGSPYRTRRLLRRHLEQVTRAQLQAGLGIAPAPGGATVSLSLAF
jgi:hypothetical protein